MDTEGPPHVPQSDVDPAHPGTSGIWTFVFIDMVVFALFFLVFVSEKIRLPEVFRTSQALLNPAIGLAGTLLLLTSSWFVARAVHHVRGGNGRVARIEIDIAIILGVGFVANKFAEYGAKFADNLTPVTNGFFTFYFLITFFHFLHVIGGLLFLGHCRMRLADELGAVNFRKKIENTGLFWHFVDMLWLFIFPMLYLTGSS